MIAILDCRTPVSVQAALKQRGFESILLPPHPALPTPVSSHPDLLLFFTDSLCFTVKSYQRIAAPILDEIVRKTDRDLVLCDEELGEKYPNDTLLDAAEIGGRLICYPEHTSKRVLEQFQNNVIPVRQGYAKCACVPVSDRALITADPSIAKAARSAGLSILTIAPGKIDLPGYDTGLIGGTASYSMISDMNEIYFCGNLRLHPNGEEIREFCQQHGKNAVSLGDFPLTDVGTMFLL